MPTISVFYGNAEHRARISIETGDVLDGRLPPRATRLVDEWAGLHRDALAANWERAQELRPLERIEPLP